MAHPPVPRLNLAPKLKRPLSLFNPLDYLRLLYWVFYFPQALRWYLDTFGGGYIPEKEMNWRKGLEIIQNNRVQRELYLQGLLLTVVVPVAICELMDYLVVNIDWNGLMLGVVLCVAFGAAFGVMLGVAFGVEMGMTFGVALAVAEGVAEGVAEVVALGMAFGMATRVATRVAGAGSVAFGMATGDVATRLGFGVVAGVAFGVGVTRLDSWLLSLPGITKYRIPHITSLPYPSLSRQIRQWLRSDYQLALFNINQLLAYTLQFIPVIDAVNIVLRELSDELIIYWVAQLAEDPFDWYLVRFASTSLANKLKQEFLNKLWIVPKIFKQNWLSRLDVNLRLDPPFRAAAAGFWYLHEQKPAQAHKAFAVTRSLDYGEEMYVLAHTLARFDVATDIDEISALKILPFSTEPLLRPQTWVALNSLIRVVRRCSKSTA